MYTVIFITASGKKEADKIAKALLKHKLAACVNIIKSIESIFWWQGKVQKAKEVLLIVKSKKEKLAGIIRLVKSMHSYSVPEIISLPIIAGNKPYLDWVNESIR
jgi:periplasmic divalent cation tolerance protein